MRIAGSGYAPVKSFGGDALVPKKLRPVRD